MNFEVSFVPKYNLNKKKWVKVILVVIAILMIASPLIGLIIHLFAL